MESDLRADIAECNAWVEKHNVWIDHKIKQYGFVGWGMTVPYLTDAKAATEDATSVDLFVNNTAVSTRAGAENTMKISEVTAKIAEHQRAIANLAIGPMAIYASQEATAAEAISRAAAHVARSQDIICENIQGLISSEKSKRSLAATQIGLHIAVAVCEAARGAMVHYNSVSRLTEGYECADASEDTRAAWAVCDTSARVEREARILGRQQREIDRANNWSTAQDTYADAPSAAQAARVNGSSESHTLHTEGPSCDGRFYEGVECTLLVLSGVWFFGTSIYFFAQAMKPSMA